jgi:hypothetical protein
MKFPWQRNGHANVHAVTIIVSDDELMQLETEAVQERMSIPEYARAKLFAPDLTPSIKQMYERARRIDEQMVRFADAVGKLAEREESEG